MFISIDGIDGCGKTTVATRLARNLERLGKNVIHVFDPKGTPEGLELYRMMCRNYDGNGCNVSYSHMALARYYLLKYIPSSFFSPNNTDNILICERGILSSFVYQPNADHVMIDKAFGIYDWQPHMFFIIDVEVQTAISRMGDRLSDKYDSDGEDAMEIRREGFLNSRSKWNKYHSTLRPYIDCIWGEGKSVDKIVEIIETEMRKI